MGEKIFNGTIYRGDKENTWKVVHNQHLLFDVLTTPEQIPILLRVKNGTNVSFTIDDETFFSPYKIAKLVGIENIEPEPKDQALKLAGKLAIAAKEALSADVKTLSQKMSNLEIALDEYNNFIFNNLK